MLLTQKISESCLLSNEVLDRIESNNYIAY